MIADNAPSTVVDVLAATLYKEYHDRNHKLWNIRSTKKYSNQRKPTSFWKSPTDFIIWGGIEYTSPQVGF